MIENNLQEGVALYQMVTSNYNIRQSIYRMAYRVIEMCHSERFDPTSLLFQIISPLGEPNKLHITLMAAEYSTAPIIEKQDRPNDSSMVLVHWVDSLYKAIGATSSMLGFLNVCPGLCDLIFSVTRYIHTYYYKYNRADLRREMAWDCFDHWVAKDLVIVGIIPS